MWAEEIGICSIFFKKQTNWTCFSAYLLCIYSIVSVSTTFSQMKNVKHANLKMPCFAIKISSWRNPWNRGILSSTSTQNIISTPLISWPSVYIRSDFDSTPTNYPTRKNITNTVSRRIYFSESRKNVFYISVFLK